MENLEGIIVATLTPMNSDGSEIDLSPIKDYVDFLYTRGVHGIFVNGTTGEGMLLDLNEKKKLLYEFKKHADGKLKVISHCGALNYKEIEEMIEISKNLAVDAIAVVTPFYYRHSDDEILYFYRFVCEKADELPVLGYNIPGLTNNWIRSEIVEKLKNSCSNFIGVKDSSGDFTHILSLLKTGLSIFVGYDVAFLASLIMGAKGCVSGPGGVFPEFFDKVWKYFKNENLSNAHEYQEILSQFSLAIGNGGDIPLLKSVLKLRGIDLGGVRFPLKQTSKEKLEIVKEKLEKLSSKYSIDLKIC
ncbi:MAG: dihydrodipicolinate synthase family protein [Thermosipho sp. (in: Bacteria)]|nr:dihydrodipicolinate synthase family protein [Thermosipho sp. (in: thermotogales)]